MQVDGTVAIVTGAAGGIGAAIARALVDAGGRVVVTDIDERAVTAVADGLNANHSDTAAALAGDASDEEHIDATVRLAETRFGPVDFYFANAGISGSPGLYASDEAWSTTLDVNVLAHVRAARRLVPDWLERGGGYFVSTASAAGLLTQLGSATYAVTKHAAVGFAEWLAATYGDRGVRVSCLCPMGVDTKLLRPQHGPDNDDEQLMQRAVETAGAVLSADAAAATVIAALDDEPFLILPHPEVLEMYRHKGADYDRWIHGMQRFRRSLTDADG